VSAYTVTTAPGGFELLMDDTNGRGRIVVLALHDGKAWTYSWPRCNRGSPADEDVVTWAAGCALDYVAKKFGAHDWFDVEQTVGGLRSCIAEARRQDPQRWTREQARELWNSLEDVYDEAAWSHWLDTNRDGDPDLYVQDACEHTTYGVDPVFRKAWLALVPFRKRVRVAS
jgi:hypothetical protein